MIDSYQGGSDESSDEAEDTLDNLSTPERELRPPPAPKAPSINALRSSQQVAVGEIVRYCELPRCAR